MTKFHTKSSFDLKEEEKIILRPLILSLSAVDYGNSSRCTAYSLEIKLNVNPKK